MEEKYNPHKIEEKWQERWDHDHLYEADEISSKPKWYFLLMFPYPSGPLHAGHWFMYGPPDAKARYFRMKGYNVLFPMGFDAFGLPAENAAIKHGVHPKEWTFRNIEQMRKSFRSMGASFDWSREVITCNPNYYRWTQWLFLQMYKNNLAYRTYAPVDWCSQCNTTLAREQVIGENRECERCRTPVIKKDLNQWLFRITNYADELLDFSGIDWPEHVIAMQRNWVGRSEGANIIFKSEAGEEISVFTTRPETVFGASFICVAPEHSLVERLTTPDRRVSVEQYAQQARRLTEIARLSTEREKTGVFSGTYAVNPVNDQLLPIFIADYVLAQYGTGTIMGVPAHDARDFAFAQKYDLRIPVVIAPPGWDDQQPPTEAYTGEGRTINSGQFNNLPNTEAGKAIIAELAQQGSGSATVSYRLRDWLVSRQRFWGAPIPILHCERCGMVPVPEKDLPVMLPDNIDFMPTGESPLKHSQSFRYTNCPECGGRAERETDTMDTFVDSSWYWYRYTSPHDESSFMSPGKEGAWLPVDEYAGGVEHATMHLLYARFMTKALRDMGYVSHDEPFLRLFNQGLILGEDDEKMSKSRGNVIDPNDQVAMYGTDVFRTFLMFIGPWARGGPWSSQGIKGVERFYQKVWNLVVKPVLPKRDKATDEHVLELRRRTHQTIFRVEHGIERFEFNTAVAGLMEFVNLMTKFKETLEFDTNVWAQATKTLLLLLAPFGPHLAEELWMFLGYPYSVHLQTWPEYDESVAAESVFTLVINVNGKVRDKIEVPVSIDEDEAKRLALQSEKVRPFLKGLEPKRIIYIPQRLINIVA